MTGGRKLGNEKGAKKGRSGTKKTLSTRGEKTGTTEIKPEQAYRKDKERESVRKRYPPGCEHVEQEEEEEEELRRDWQVVLTARGHTVHDGHNTLRARIVRFNETPQPILVEERGRRRCVAPALSRLG